MSKIKSRVGDITMAPCLARNNTVKTLSKPPPCSKNNLSQEQPPIDYKGPFLSRSVTIVPGKFVKPTPRSAVNALTQEKIPESWSWRESGGNKIERGDRNQGSCGCCWAMSFSSALGDRYALKYNIAAPYPSTMGLVSCCGPDVGSDTRCGDGTSDPCPVLAKNQCECGGSTFAAGLWLEDGGSIGLESCWPFSTISRSPKDNNGAYIAPKCPNFANTGENCCADCCGNSDAIPRFSVEKDSTRYVVVHENNDPDPEATIRAIQKEIMTGPVVASFWQPDDFESWWQANKGTTNIYAPTIAPDPPNRGHTITLTGWGKEGNTKYWEIRNTWGSPGYARFAMSTSTPEPYWTCIDIPFYREGSWWGGVVTMKPGPLTKWDWKPGKGGKPIGGGWMEPTRTPNWGFLIVIGMILLALVLIVFIINNL